MAEYRITLDACTSIAIMRVENGWLIRDENQMRGTVTPLRVAETPEALAKIVRDWAASQMTTEDQ